MALNGKKVDASAVSERRHPLREVENVKNRVPRFAFKVADQESARMLKQSCGIEYRTSDGKGFRCPNPDCSRPCPFESTQCGGCGLLCRWDAGIGVVICKERDKIEHILVHNDMRTNASTEERPRQGIQKAGGGVRERRKPFRELQNVQNQSLRSFKVGKLTGKRKKSLEMEDKVMDVSSKSDNLAHELQEAHAKLADMKAKYEDLKNGRDSVLADRDVLALKLVDANAKYNDIKMGNESVSHERDVLARKLVEANSKLAVMESKFNDLKMGNESVSTERDLLADKLVDANAERDVLSHKLAEATAKLAVMESKFNDLKMGNESVSTKRDLLADKLVDANAERDVLAHKLGDATAKLTVMESKCNDLKMGNGPVLTERDLLADKIVDANAERDVLPGKPGEATAKLGAMESKCIDLTMGNESELTERDDVVHKRKEANTKLPLMEAIGKAPKKEDKAIAPKQTCGGAVAKSSAYSGSKLRNPIFPEVLHSVISDITENGSAISWLPHGRGFVICDKIEFASRVLPLHFGSAKWSSFIRRLKRWNFECVHWGPEMGAYYHRSFLRGRPDLVGSMTYLEGRGDHPLG